MGTETSIPGQSLQHAIKPLVEMGLADGKTFASLVFAFFIFLATWHYLRLRRLASVSENPEACRRLGMPPRDSISVTQDVGTYQDIKPGKEVSWRVKSLWIYPIKSCRWVQLEVAEVTGNGFQYDRQFAFARLQKTSKAGEAEAWKWVFVTQRNVPKMATIKTEVWIPDPSSPQYSSAHPNVRSNGVLVIKYPGGTGGSELAVEVPFSPTPDHIRDHNMELKNMTIWRDSPQGLIVTTSEVKDSWIENLRSYLQLNVPLALFRVTNPAARELYRNAPRKEELGYQPAVCFQDAYPLHILNVASVRDVAQKYEEGDQSLSTRNFRPNIVVEGGEAYAEDSWKSIEIGVDKYHVSCRTVRCLLPNVNPITGERRNEPNKTLKSFRRIDTGDPNNACLGMQMVPAVEDKRTIRVGDAIVVLETGDHTYIQI